MLDSREMNKVTLCCHRPAFLKRKCHHFCCLGKSLSLLSCQDSCQTPHKSRGMMVVWPQSSKGDLCLVSLEMSSNSFTDVGGKDDEWGASEPSSMSPRSTTVIPIWLIGVMLKNWHGLLRIILLTWTALLVQCVIRWLSHLWFPDTVSARLGLVTYMDLFRTLTDWLLFIFIRILY